MGPGPVVYRMQREQRAADNFGLLYSQEKSLELKRPLEVVFCLADAFLGAGHRQAACATGGRHRQECLCYRFNIL